MQPLPPGYVLPGMMPRPSNRAAVALFAFAALLLFVGALTIQLRVLIPRPSSYYPGGPDYETWATTVRVLAFAGTTLLGAGVFLFCLSGFLVGMERSDLPDSLRRALIYGPMALAVAMLIILLLLASTFSFYP